MGEEVMIPNAPVESNSVSWIAILLGLLILGVAIFYFWNNDVKEDDAQKEIDNIISSAQDILNQTNQLNASISFEELKRRIDLINNQTYNIYLAALAAQNKTTGSSGKRHRHITPPAPLY